VLGEKGERGEEINSNGGGEKSFNFRAFPRRNSIVEKKNRPIVLFHASPEGASQKKKGGVVGRYLGGRKDGAQKGGARVVSGAQFWGRPQGGEKEKNR